jgi:hypothetical protein
MSKSVISIIYEPWLDSAQVTYDSSVDRYRHIRDRLENECREAIDEVKDHMLGLIDNEYQIEYEN